MHNLGQTRSSQQPNHLLLTADTFVRTPLPGMKSCTAIVHAGPAIGAKFTQYTAEFEAGGELGSTPAQRFIFVMEGASHAWKLTASEHELGDARLRLFARRLAASCCGREDEPCGRDRKALSGAGLGRSAAPDRVE